MSDFSPQQDGPFAVNFQYVCDGKYFAHDAVIKTLIKAHDGVLLDSGMASLSGRRLLHSKFPNQRKAALAAKAAETIGLEADVYPFDEGAEAEAEATKVVTTEFIDEIYMDVAKWYALQYKNAVKLKKRYFDTDPETWSNFDPKQCAELKAMEVAVHSIYQRGYADRDAHIDGLTVCNAIIRRGLADGVIKWEDG